MFEPSKMRNAGQDPVGQYRLKAKHYRRAADIEIEPNRRDAYETLADTFERLAADYERIEAS